MPRNSTGPPQLSWVSVCRILKGWCFQGLMLKSPQLLDDKRNQAWHRKLGLEQYRWLFTKELRDVRTNCQSLRSWRCTKKIPGDFMLFQGDNLTVVMGVFSCLWCIRIAYSSIEIGQNCWDAYLFGFLSRCCLWQEGEADMWVSVPLSFSRPHQLTLSSLPRDSRPTQSSWSCLGNSEVRKSPYVQSSKVCKCFEEREVVALPATFHCLLCNFPSVYPSCSLLSESEGLSRGSSTRSSLFLGMFHSQMWTWKDLFQLWQRDLLYEENTSHEVLSQNDSVLSKQRVL